MTSEEVAYFMGLLISLERKNALQIEELPTGHILLKLLDPNYEPSEEVRQIPILTDVKKRKICFEWSAEKECLSCHNELCGGYGNTKGCKIIQTGPPLTRKFYIYLN